MYIDLYTKVEIICPTHGNFFITPESFLLKKRGCPRCKKQIRWTTKKFIDYAKKQYGNKYDYSKTKYINNKTNIIITCPIHGDFEKRPDHFFLDYRGGCPKCKGSTGEQRIETWMMENNIAFEREKSFEDLKGKTSLRYDFYLPEKNMVIEYNGEEHYKARGIWKKTFKIHKHYDWLKRQYAKDNNIKFLSISYWDDEILFDILKNNI